MYLPQRLHRRLARQVELALLTRAGSLSSARAQSAALPTALATAEASLAALRARITQAQAHV
ncbi:MAG: hypothetical protein ABIO70_16070, partial [Pseudomonadota bacterium]